MKKCSQQHLHAKSGAKKYISHDIANESTRKLTLVKVFFRKKMLFDESDFMCS